MPGLRITTEFVSEDVLLLPVKMIKLSHEDPTYGYTFASRHNQQYKIFSHTFHLSDIAVNTFNPLKPPYSMRPYCGNDYGCNF